MLSCIPRTQSAGACQLWYCRYRAYTMFEWGKIQAMQSLSYQLICRILMSIQFTLHCILGMKMGEYSLAEPPCTYPGIGIKSGISVCELISTQKKKKRKHMQGMNGRPFSKTPRKQKPPPLMIIHLTKALSEIM